MTHYRKILAVLLDEDINQEDIRTEVFSAVDIQTLKEELDTIEEMLGNNYSDNFKQVIARHSYMRQFAPALVKHITFQSDTQDKTSEELIEAVDLLNRMNAEGKHTLPKNAPTGFIPKRLHPFVFQDGKPQKPLGNVRY
jgi:hypothetical protein